MSSSGRRSTSIRPTAQVTTISDPLPQILEGIPLRLRSIRVNLDRPDFALNPTNCDPLSVEADVSGDEGATSPRRSTLPGGQLRRACPTSPKLTLSAQRRPRAPRPSRRSTRSSPRKPGRSEHAAGLGDAAQRASCSTTPTSGRSAPGRVRRRHCPEGSQIGEAEVTTPLLDQPLRGSVYLRSSRHGLPDLVAGPQGPVRHRSDRARRQRQRPPAHHLRNRPGRAGLDASTSTSPAARKGWSSTAKASAGRQEGDGEDGRPERSLTASADRQVEVAAAVPVEPRAAMHNTKGGAGESA